MEKINSRKIKLLKIWEILNRETDEGNPMSTPTLIARLGEMGIEVDRKILYSDIKLLIANGYDIKQTRTTSNGYYVVDRSFDIPEIRVLMDAVQAASFITPKKTKGFVSRIAQLAGDKKAEVMEKNTVEFHTPKSDNEKIFYSVDAIGSAIEQHHQISFLYFDFDIKHNRVYRKDKRRYVVNPLSTVFSMDNYYLMCFDDRHPGIAHYRIDRMDDVRIEETPITESEESKQFDLSRHKRQLFGMFNGDDERVTFQAEKKLVDHIFDRFGDDVEIAYGENDIVVFSVDVKISIPFLGWCCSFGKMLKVTSPQSVADQVREYANIVASQYE